MTLPTLVLALGALSLVLALPALLGRREETSGVRAATLLALAAIWLAAGDWPARARQRTPAMLEVVATGPGDGGWRRRLERAAVLQPGATVTVTATAGGDPSAAWLAATLRARDPRDVALVWDGGFTVPDDAQVPLAVGKVYTTTPPPPIEPGAVALRAIGVFEAGRPSGLELELARDVRERLPTDAATRLWIADPTGDPVHTSDIQSAELRGGAVRVAWTPERSGPHALKVELRSGNSTIVAAGELAVVDARIDVLVVGDGAEVVVAALRAQGVDARSAERLPDALPDGGVLVALSDLDVDAQQRVDEFCDAGGGLVLVGGQGGGALPKPGAPLVDACPLVVLPEAASDEAGGSGAGDGPGGEAAGDPAGPPPPGVTPPGDPPPPGPPSPDQPTETAVQGETAGAQGTPIEDAEVERRGVALVLVIDRSGSMSERVAAAGGASKMDFAKRSAFETARLLEAGDELGIVSFGATAREVLMLGPIPTELELRAAVERLRAVNENTLVADAAERAAEWLKGSTAPVRHAVILTDGENLDPGDVGRAQAAARNMAARGVTVSVIQIASSRFGLASDVARIARFGKGQFVRETDGSAIPRLIFAEVRRALGAAGRRPAGEDPAAGAGDGPGAPSDPAAAAGDATDPGARTEPETTDPPPDPPESVVDDPPPEPSDPEPTALRVIALERSPLLVPLPEDRFPDLFGANAVAATRRAHVLLATADGTPLLAFGHRGLGRVAAWASDWTGPWSRAWRDDASFPSRLATWIAAVRPAPTNASDADRLTGPRTLSPPAPTAAEHAFLAGAALLRPVADLALPTTRVVERERGRAADFALLALPTLLLLAFVEWRAGRR